MKDKKIIIQNDMKFDSMVETLRVWLTTSPESGRLWDLITGLRGPDSPSETGEMSPSAHSAAYVGRRARKRKTVEIIRGISGLRGGSCRHREDIKYITIPTPSKQDHFDRHMVKAAMALGIEIKYE